MSNMHTTVSGNLIFDPEFRKFDSDKFLTKFRLATSRVYRTGDVDANNNPIWQETDTLYLDVECWGQLAVNAAASLFKGAPVLVSGYLVTDSWEDPKLLDDNGKALIRQKIKMKASRVGFELSNHQLSSKRTNSQENTPNGMSSVELQTPDDLVSGTHEPRRSAEDLVSATPSETGSQPGREPEKETAPF